MEKLPELKKEQDLDIPIFKNGKHKGSSFEKVRQNNPGYFLYLVSQPLGAVIDYVPFVNYCMDYLTNSP